MMNLNYVTAGPSLPEQFNVVIEIPMHADPIKYEVDKASGAIFVDRIMLSTMRYPCNYGYIPQTLSEDKDPIDVLVITPFPIHIGAVIPCRAIGMLQMEDESGIDAKILALPTEKIYSPYRDIKKFEDLPFEDLSRIQHFFEHYKDLENGKWVKIKGWQGPKTAHHEIISSVERYKELKK